MAQGKRSAAQKIKAEESKYKALDLRKQGKSIRAIAATLKISIGATHKAINDALNEAIEENAKAGESLRLLELERLDALWEGVWPHAIKGNAAAVQACLRIMERRAKLLGLDAPTQNKHEVEMPQAMQALEMLNTLSQQAGVTMEALLEALAAEAQQVDDGS